MLTKVSLLWAVSATLLATGCHGGGRHAPTQLVRGEVEISPTATPTLTPAATPTPPGPPTAEEYAVYSALIDDTDFLKWPHSFPGAKGGPVAVVIIQEYTLSKFSHELWMPTDAGPRSWPGKLFESLPEAIIRDFKAMNATGYRLENRFHTQVQSRLITGTELNKIFKDDQDDWDRFYKRYPYAQGILRFSRVGFDAEKNVALVYAGCQRHDRAGAGFFFVLKKENQTWKVAGKQMTWIS